jgi:transcriptional regulator with GAF, ATPase, and Fis domain
MMEKIIQHEYPVLILGESGTGKELVARSIHFSGPRKDRPFAPVDCSALVPTLIESELFGYVKGAFTGAMQAKQGLLEAAQGVPLFLDEIGDMPVDLQAKLLRALQERGSNRGLDRAAAHQRSNYRRHQSRPGVRDSNRSLSPGPLFPAQRCPA